MAYLTDELELVETSLLGSVDSSLDEFGGYLSSFLPVSDFLSDLLFINWVELVWFDTCVNKCL